MIVNRHHIKSPIEVIQTKLNIPNNQLEQYIKEIYRISKPDNSSNLVGLMTSFQIWKESNFFSPILKKISLLLESLKINADSRISLKIVETWGGIYKKGHYSNVHAHSPAFYSYVYYLNASSTPIVFKDCNFELYPKTDEIILFPGHLKHFVPVHNSDEARIILAGNVVLVPPTNHGK